ncbi:YdiU family protein [Sulfuricaulis sp.]|uniref:protein adenylyltransferase SelO n=1 Tax=Sulfuricaulis sp. TaxID=2003553 RepID=UPI00355AB66B
MHSLQTLPFSNSFAALPDVFYSRVAPTPFQTKPTLIHFNAKAAALLDLDPAVQHDPRFVEVFSGNHKLPGMDPIAMLYAGHQFGHYVPQLGDGRAILLGETTNARGEKWEIQLKGSGLTPYSRDADGRAVLRSSIREYLCSEAMHGLGIPTTRALCLVGSEDEVHRERIETGAMLTRLAPSHVRFGSFEVLYYREQLDHLRLLADYVIARHYPDLAEKPDRYPCFLQTVVERTARLLAQWQAVGFAHGVMNTDNMSILGLTLDYGPYGFMEAYQPGLICNHSDHHGRYAFDKQSRIGLFNLSCLAQTLLPLIEVDAAKAALDSYSARFTEHYQRLMAQKLGFEDVNPRMPALLKELLDQMQQSRVDYTLLFRALGEVERDGGQAITPLRDKFVDRARFDRWLADYRACLRTDAQSDGARGQAMRSVNPKYVLRNYLAQMVIEKAERGDYAEIDRLLTILHAPFEDHPSMTQYADPPPDGARQIEVSCSS